MSTLAPVYEPHANATLTVDLASLPLESGPVTGWITDPATGNLIPNPQPEGSVPSPIHKLVYKAHLHLVRQPQYQKAAGVDSTNLYLEGMLLDPWQFDDLIAPNQIFDAVFQGLKGKYELLPEQSMLPAFKSVLGTRLIGVFRMSGAGKPHEA